MRVGVLGTGIVGRTIAGKLGELGHDVSIGTRDPAALAERTEPDYMGNPPFPVWHADHPNIGVTTFEDVAPRSELVVNATNGAGSLEALRAAGEHNLDGKILIDVSNPRSARGMEMALPLWLAIVMTSNDPMFNFSIVR